MNPLVAPEAHARPHRTALSVNVNKIALLRNTRHIGIPDVVKLSRQALEAGAQGITVHPRPDGGTSARRTCTTCMRCCSSGPRPNTTSRATPSTT
jgi:hypothetical protein